MTWPPALHPHPASEYSAPLATAPRTGVHPLDSHDSHAAVLPTPGYINAGMHA